MVESLPASRAMVIQKPPPMTNGGTQSNGDGDGSDGKLKFITKKASQKTQ